MESFEKKIREDLSICHHYFALSGWDDMLGTHLSARLDQSHIILTPHNHLFEEITPEGLVKCDQEGKIFHGTSLMPQAKEIHLPVYQAHPDVNCILHLHAPATLAVSCLEDGFLFCHQQSLRFYKEISYYPFSGLALNGEGKNIAAALKKGHVLILQNHGVIIVGQTIAQALYMAYYFEVSCKIQLDIMASGRRIIEIPEEICHLTYEQFNEVKTVDHELEAFRRRVKRAFGFKG